MKIRQFANVLNLIGAPDATAAASLLLRKLDHYGTCSIFLGLNLTPVHGHRELLDRSGEVRIT